MTWLFRAGLALVLGYLLLFADNRYVGTSAFVSSEEKIYAAIKEQTKVLNTWNEEQKVNHAVTNLILKNLVESDRDKEFRLRALERNR